MGACDRQSRRGQGDAVLYGRVPFALEGGANRRVQRGNLEAVQNIFENSDFVYMLNQAGGDREILAKQLNISPHQLSYVTHSGEGEGLLFYGNVILPFADKFPKNTELYRIMTTKPNEKVKAEVKP